MSAVKGNRKLTQKSSTPFKLGKNVRSSVSRRLIGFKYGEKSAMLNGGENPDRRKLAAKMETARDLPSVPPKLCGECSGWAREGSTDRVCSWCLGVGVMSGDSPYKDQLRDGPPFKLEVRPSPGKGLGTFAGQDIPNGVAVMESEGVIMTEQEAAKLDPEYKRKGLHYTISVPGEWHGEGKRRRWVIDLTNMVIAHTILNLFLHFLSGASITLTHTGSGAGRQGNVSRLVNHKCADQNLVVRIFAASATFSKTWQEKVPCHVLLRSVRILCHGSFNLLELRGGACSESPRQERDEEEGCSADAARH